jgi:hypothetical protein
MPRAERTPLHAVGAGQEAPHLVRSAGGELNNGSGEALHSNLALHGARVLRRWCRTCNFLK